MNGLAFQWGLENAGCIPCSGINHWLKKRGEYDCISTLTQSGSAYKGSIYQSNKSL